MRIGIIDFGTNTLRLNIFEVDEPDYLIIYDGTIYSKVVENTVENNLTQDGIEHIIEAIEEHQAVCKHYRCDRIECFSTASLRYINNSEDILEQVEFRTGIKIRKIDGNEEAKYDYLALKSVISEKCGNGCDLGGGSLQIFSFNETGATKSYSFPFGSSRLTKQFVCGIIPTPNEIQNIKKEVSNGIKSKNFQYISDTLYTMGGTAKSIELLFTNVLKKEGPMKTEDLNTMIKIIIDNPDESIELFEEYIPSRIKTITPGIAILSAVMEALNCKDLNVYTVGVREGFLEDLLKQPPQNANSILDIISSIL